MCQTELSELKLNIGDTFILQEFDSKEKAVVNALMPVRVIVCSKCGYAHLLID